MSAVDPPDLPQNSAAAAAAPAEGEAVVKAAAPVEVGDPWELLDEARAALRWAAWSGLEQISWQRAALPAGSIEPAAASPVRSSAASPARSSAAPRTPAAPLQPKPAAPVRTRLSRRPRLRPRAGADTAGPVAGPSTAASTTAASPTAALPPATQPRAATPRPTGLAMTARAAVISGLHTRIGDCERCELSRRRRHIVHGMGPLDARIVFVATGPYDDEDGAGEPFAGEDGALLDRMLAAMGLSRGEVFLTGLVRCHLGPRQEPEKSALQRCTPFLRTELTTVAPEVVVLLGDAASQFLLRQVGVAQARGRWHTLLGIPTMATWDLPLVRQQPHRKREVWQDLQLVMARLGLRRPGSSH